MKNIAIALGVACLCGSAMAADEMETRLDARTRINNYPQDVREQLQTGPQRANLPARKIHPTDNMAEELNRMHNPMRHPVHNYNQWQDPDDISPSAGYSEDY